MCALLRVRCCCITYLLPQRDDALQVLYLPLNIRTLAHTIIARRIVLDQQQADRLAAREPPRVRTHPYLDRLLRRLADAASPQRQVEWLARLARQRIVRRQGESRLHRVRRRLLILLRHKMLDKVALQDRVAPQAGDLDCRGVPSGHMAMRVDRTHKRGRRLKYDSQV